MVKVRNLKPVNKMHHLKESENEFGHHTKHTFSPNEDIIVRCPKCSNLFASDMMDEAEITGCPNCHWRYTKEQARDIYVEAKYIKTIYGNWNHEILDLLSQRDESSLVRPDRSITPINDVARQLVSKSVEGIREHERRRIANQLMVDALRSDTHERFDF